MNFYKCFYLLICFLSPNSRGVCLVFHWEIKCPLILHSTLFMMVCVSTEVNRLYSLAQKKCNNINCLYTFLKKQTKVYTVGQTNIHLYTSATITGVTNWLILL